ncbi:MAG: hypothetical protein JSS27_07275 [Planctomycetes bacterium]|nr:hypothetical protein [Planctomycetota bacterium]
MNCASLVLYCSLALAAPPATQATIDTVAGNGKPGNNGATGPATEMSIDQPFGVEVGPDGALYVTEVGTHRIRRVDLKTGALTTVAGNGRKGYTGDGGPATEASLNEPYEVRFDRAGNMIFVEMQNHIVRRVDVQTGVITTVAGTGRAGFGGDGGPATKAQFSSPHSIALDREDNIYIADILNHRIRRVDAKTGIVETIAGTGDKKLPDESKPARGQPIFGPRALYIVGDTLWIALREGNSVWSMSLVDGQLKRVAGTGKKGFTGDGGPPLEATFDGPKGIAVDSREMVYVVDTENQTIRLINPLAGTISTFAGVGPKSRGYAGDGGPATAAHMDRPHGICVSQSGAVFIGDTNNHRVRHVPSQPSVTIEKGTRSLRVRITPGDGRPDD